MTLGIIGTNLLPLRFSARVLVRSATARNIAYSSKPLRLAIVGSGPAGFYAAARVLQKSDDAWIDMYEQLPVPFGLVRYGIAPDHPEVKNCQERFEEVAASSRFNFIGNVSIGHDLPLATMRNHYDALLFSYGTSQDRLLDIPGETLHGVLSARAFVGWYNGLPEFADLRPDLGGENAVVIGNGNVALDVARVLLTDVDVLRKSDMADQALEGLSKSKIKNVTIAGRRGPMQAAFTIKEMRELINLPKVKFSSGNKDLLPSTQWIERLPRLERRKYRLAKLLAKGSPNHSAPKTCSLLPLVAPLAFESGSADGRLSKATFQHNRFENEERKFEANVRVELTDETSSLDATLALRSIGYKASPLPGLQEALGIDFHKPRGVMQNDGLGRALSVVNVSSETNPPVAASVVPGCYCSGWIKTGPNGVIASTMEDAFTTAETILADWYANEPFLNGPRTCRPNKNATGWEALQGEVQGGQPVFWKGWQAIDGYERSQGRLHGHRPRVKLTNISDMITKSGQYSGS